MVDWFMVAGSALWLGILTSFSPCPLATNIAAITYIGKRVDRSGAAIWTGVCYAGGRTIAYVFVGLTIIFSLFSVPTLSMWLQDHMIRIIGPLLILSGFIVIGVLSGGTGFSLPGATLHQWIQHQADTRGLLGAVILGFFFALSFCPVSAALFFGSLIPIALQQRSGFLLPVLYGIGTALPVLAAGVLMAAGGGMLGRTLNRVTEFEKWFRWVTGLVFIGVGLYFTIVYTLEIMF